MNIKNEIIYAAKSYVNNSVHFSARDSVWDAVDRIVFVSVNYSVEASVNDSVEDTVNNIINTYEY